MTARKRAPRVVSSLVIRAGHFVTDPQSLLLHAGLFVLILLTGIARYGRAMPPNPIILMTLWSIGLALHGALVYRADSPARSGRRGRDGVVSAVALAAIVNGVMWSMWMLATESSDSTQWHVATMLAMLMTGVVGVIAGKRALYRHWLNGYLRENGVQKPKRERQTRFADDGEIEDDVWLDEDDEAARFKRQS